MMVFREVDGLKVAFVSGQEYFSSFTTPSMVSTWRATGADVVFLLSPGKKESDVTDEVLRDWISEALKAKTQRKLGEPYGRDRFH